MDVENHFTKKQLLYVDHFPCETCGQDPYWLVRSVRFGSFTDGIEICPKGLVLLTVMLEEQNIDISFEPPGN